MTGLPHSLARLGAHTRGPFSAVLLSFCECFLVTTDGRPGGANEQLLREIFASFALSESKKEEAAKEGKKKEEEGAGGAF